MRGTATLGDGDGVGRFLLPAPLVLLAPLVFALHVYEEYPGFIEWMARRTDVPMTVPEFVVINGVAFLVTLVLAGLSASRGSPTRSLVLLAWLAFLMLANGILHLVATAIDRAYVPGALTSGLLYLPYFAIVFASCRRTGGIALGSALRATLLGTLPMLLQGAAILVSGRRLLW
jgi:hypothetical protein